MMIQRRSPCRLCGKPKPPGRGRTFCSDRCSKRSAQLSLQRYRDRQKGEIDAYKLAQGCSRCGYDKCPAALDFHHRPGEAKELEPTRTSASRERLWAEIAKCDLLCANCHREEHFVNSTRRLSRDPGEFPEMHDPRVVAKRWATA